MRSWLIIGALLLALTGCRSQRHIETTDKLQVVVVRDTVERLDRRVDSVYIREYVHDSIVVTIDTAGAVTAKERYHTEGRERDAYHEKDLQERQAHAETDSTSLATREETTQELNTRPRIRIRTYVCAFVLGLLLGALAMLMCHLKLVRHG